MINRLKILFLLLIVHPSFIAECTDSLSNDQNSIFALLNIPFKKNVEYHPVKIAVVDDGFRLTHNLLKDHIYTNPEEILGNYRDDDGNGFVDDIKGWDISDNDNDVSVPKGREKDFYHGTYIAGVIVNTAKKFFGEEAGKFIKIIPVKVRSNSSESSYFFGGYKGIKYAANTDADVICCSWSGGALNSEEKEILAEALAKGKIIVSSVGNLWRESVDPPASFPGIIAVSAIDSDYIKHKKSSFGMRVDLSAPGANILSAHPLADSAYIYESGTSPAAAIIAGVAAIMKSVKPDADSEEILEALQQSSFPIDSFNSTYAGKLGSGIPNVAKAIKYLTDSGSLQNSFNPSKTKGKIYYGEGTENKLFNITPLGDFKGIHIIPEKYDDYSRIKIFRQDSVYYSGKTIDIKNGIFVDENDINIEFLSKPNDLVNTFYYFVQTLDSSKLFCDETIFVTEEEGVLTDGSSEVEYSNRTSCKWQFILPQDKVLQMDFTKMDTQANLDFVWIFEGESALQENLIAKFSGSNKPPIITSRSNKVMLWFLTDNFITNDGWELHYKFVNKPINNDTNEVSNEN